VGGLGAITDVLEEGSSSGIFENGCWEDEAKLGGGGGSSTISKSGGSFLSSWDWGFAWIVIGR
jgi:hypothetical protein